MLRFATRPCKTVFKNRLEATGSGGVEEVLLRLLEAQEERTALASDG